ncbi:hypothetical protein [Levilactobacillus brevis]|nr:hypothetical protein [Levilactobacillus brevis]KIO95747.1 hypothetical protein N624_1861 [Levilactobacillus brevis]
MITKTDVNLFMIVNKWSCIEINLLLELTIIQVLMSKQLLGS